MKALINYMGFYGQIDSASPVQVTTCWRLGSPGPAFAGKSGTIQWFHPLENKVELLPETPDGQLFLAGPLFHAGNSLFSLVKDIADTIKKGCYEDLATITENAAGCFIDTAEGTIYLWVGFGSNEYAFYRRSGSWIYWSTNPLDLVYEDEDLDVHTLWRCCHGEDLFCYSQQIKRVEQGHLVQIPLDRDIQSYRFDQFTPSPRFSGKLTLGDLAEATRQALRDAVLPLAQSGETVGFMLSGGLDSAALLAVMREMNVKVRAYHLVSPDPAGSELRFAQMTCGFLQMPLTKIMMSTGQDFLNREWVSPHPDGHPWMSRFEQVACQARADGIRVLLNGIGSDSAFGPEMEYGIHSILSARISWREKIKMVKGLMVSDWNIFEIIKSFQPGKNLIGLACLAGPSQDDFRMRKADFLLPSPSCVRAVDSALQHSPCFTPQNMSVAQTVMIPNGIQIYNPYHDRRVQGVALAIPDAYRMICDLAKIAPEVRHVDLARVVTKPVLRLAVSDLLPPEVTWRTWPVYTPAPAQQFVVGHPNIFRELLGPGSYLARMGLVEQAGLERVLASCQEMRNNYVTLMASSMVEIWLAKSWRSQRERGGPKWM